MVDVTSKGSDRMSEAFVASSEQLSHISSFFKVLGDETRLRILYALYEKELYVNDLCAQLSMTKSAISHQLHLLKAEGLVRARREGKNVYYSLDDQHVVDILRVTQTHVAHKAQEA
jgi:ArsR family transcriptional regulator